jgi:serine/threonine protein kinase
LYRYAVKELLLSATPHGINSITEVLQEVEVMQALLRAGTCHVVKLHAFYRSQDTAWLVLEYVFLQSHVRLNFDPSNSSWSITGFLFYTHNMYL